MLGTEVLVFFRCLAAKLLTYNYKSSVLFVGHRQTVQTQIRRHRTRRLIRVSIVSIHNFLSEFE